MQAGRLLTRLVQVPLRQPRLFAACFGLLLCVAAAAATPGVRAWARATVSRLQPRTAESKAKPIQIASAADGADAPAVSLPYSADLDAQLAQVGFLVRDQLIARKNVAPDRAAAAGDAFAASLKTVVHTPLTPIQFAAITGSLDRQRFARVHPHPDITDLEVQWNALVWTDFVTHYLQREPMTAEEQSLLAQQVSDLVSTASAAMTTGFHGDMPASEIEDMTHYLRSLLARDLGDPVIPVLKRPFTAEEVEALKGQAAESIAHGITTWRASADSRPPMAASAVAGPINSLWGRIWQLQYNYPTLAPDLMASMYTERDDLIAKRALDFDRLPEPQKEQEWNRRLEEERRQAQ